MIVTLSPAKRLDWSGVDACAESEPLFQADAVGLARVAGRLSRADLQKLMSISPDLAKLNQQRFRDFAETPAPDATRPALYAFAGDTYQGLDAVSLDGDALRYAQDHLRILSGLYGVLRPFDRIQPYRLEMGSRLKTRKGGSLYAYWGARLAAVLADQAAATDSQAVVNCASVEYFGAVAVDRLGLPVITPVFLEDRDGTAKIVSFFAKKARGAMARFVMENRLRDPAALQAFSAGGYAFDPARSSPGTPVFVRSSVAQAAA
ncbi:MAG: peroxide stress protein YaaA [Rhodobacteraceae bacterium]|nr:peroxide stress protein YaaA [Paracoccaceae bacterium]